MRLTVDVVIPVHGHWELTERCLDSLRRRDPCVRRVIVVDDASSDDTAHRLGQRDDVVPIILEHNVGFSAACNAGARAATADAIFFLNNDTIIEPGTIERLAETLADDGVAAVGPKLLNGDGTLQAAALAMVANGSNFERLYAYLDADLPEASTSYAPLALSGAALLVRRDAFYAAGTFDEGYRNGCEDVDLCVTLWSRGYRLRYEPRATILHLEGASRGKVIDDRHNQQRFAQRWAERMGDVPRYTESLPAALDLRWRSANALEESVRRCFRAALRAHAGARVVENAPDLARILAFFDRRRLLTVEHDGTGTPAPIAWCAPRDAQDAAALVARAAREYWVPSNRAAALLREAGLPARRVHVTRPGFPVVDDPALRPLSAAVVIRSDRTDAVRVDQIRAAFGPIAIRTVIAEQADFETVEDVRNAPLVVFVDEGDPWGLLGTAALSGGALTIAPSRSPFLETAPADVFVGLPDEHDAADAVYDVLAHPERFIERGPLAARELARRLPDVYAGRRVRELGRAFVHGITDVRTLSMTDALAARFALQPDPVLR